MHNFLFLHGLLLGFAFQSIGRYITIGRHRCYPTGYTYMPSRSAVDAVIAVTNTKNNTLITTQQSEAQGLVIETKRDLVTMVTAVREEEETVAVDGGSVIEDVEVAMVEDWIIEKRKQAERRKEWRCWLLRCGGW